jgi:SAM-dependent methyltransferase
LPHRDGSFDVVAAALVLNFVADRGRALAEMRRVARRGGTIAAFVWEFETERSPSGPMRRGLRAVGGEVPAVPGTRAAGLAACRGCSSPQDSTRSPPARSRCGSSFPTSRATELADAALQPITKTIAALAEGDRERMRSLVRAELAPRLDGSCVVEARANAIKARAR